MEIKLTVPEYSGEGLKFEWENGFEIKVGINTGEVIISANKAGLSIIGKANANISTGCSSDGVSYAF